MKLTAIGRPNRLSVLIGLLTMLMIPITSCSSGNSSASSTSSPTGVAAQAIPNDAIQVGILVIRDIETTRKQYEPLLNYLSDQIGRPFVLIPLAQESQFLEVEQNKLDFVISNPLAAVQLRRLYDTNLLVTQFYPDSGTELGGQIIVKSDSSIQGVADLRGKKGACVSLETAAAGCLFQVLHLQQKGINPFLDLESLVEIPSQNDIVQRVVNGELDFGFIRTGQIESMVSGGLLESPDQVRVLEPQPSQFIYEHTTRLYPDWPVAATTKAQQPLIDEVKQALLEIPPDSPALAAIGIEKFVPAPDYGALDQLVEELQLRSWEAQ